MTDPLTDHPTDHPTDPLTDHPTDIVSHWMGGYSDWGNKK
jgi:hypothetical protein